MFESVEGRSDGCTDGRRLESHPISSPRAFGSGELKMVIWPDIYDVMCTRIVSCGIMYII